MTLDHMRLARRQPAEFARFLRLLTEVRPGEVPEVSVLHEADNSCCTVEAWPLTLQALLLAGRPAGPGARVGLLHGEGAAELLRR
jgi:hypothetical protein